MQQHRGQTVYKYLGTGAEFVYGVPARDMTEEEWQALPEKFRAEAAACGLYEKAKADKPAKPAEKAEA